MIREKFVTNNESNTLVINVFIGIAIMFLSLILGALLAWTYSYNIYTFIATLLFIILIYAIINMSYVIINKTIVDAITFDILFGSSIYIMITSFLMIIFFAIKSWKNSLVPQRPVY